MSNPLGSNDITATEVRFQVIKNDIDHLGQLIHNELSSVKTDVAANCSMLRDFIKRSDEEREKMMERFNAIEKRLIIAEQSAQDGIKQTKNEFDKKVTWLRGAWFGASLIISVLGLVMYNTVTDYVTEQRSMRDWLIRQGYSSVKHPEYPSPTKPKK